MFFQHTKKFRDGFFGQIDSVEIDGADGWKAETTVQGIVEAADGEIPRHAQAGFAQKHDNPRGLHVAQAGDVRHLATA